PLCLVCEEQEATGRHYGCVSCFSCKTYFRRAVLQRQEPGCIGPKHCDTKKLCRGCRLSKCLEMGMNRAALQPKRDAIKLRKAKPISEQRTSSASAASINSRHRKSTEQPTRAHDAAK
ncbi:NHR-19 protein, partial [Aphelenchoides avenae]